MSITTIIPLESMWMILALPLLILLAPRFVKHVVPLLLNYHRRSEKLSLHRQIAEYRKELSKISQVDEFAKYSRVQRKLRASSDQLRSIIRQDIELNVKCVLLAQALVWLTAIVICFKLIYLLYTFLADQVFKSNSFNVLSS